MAIKTISPYGVSGLLSASGGWASTPRGGLIPFSANVTLLGGGSYSPGSTYSLPRIGSFYVTSSATKTTADGDKTTLSLACILGYKANTGASGGLGSCAEYKTGSTVQTVINDLCNIAGIPSFSLPLGGTLIYEPVWLNEGENALNKITEIVTANGCVLYSSTGTDVKCESLESFVSKLSGSVSSYTIDVNNVSFPSKLPGGAVINGSQATVEDTPGTETLESRKDASILLVGPNIKSYDWTTKITTVERNFTGRKIKYTEKTTSPSPLVEEERIVETEFELPKTGSQAKVPLDVSSCYPVDPGRMIKRKTTDIRNISVAERPIWLAFFTSIDANKYTDNGYNPPGLSAKVIVSETYESWTYDTQDVAVDFGAPSAITPKTETVYYNRAEYRVPALISPQLASVTLGERPSFIKNKDLVEEIINKWVPVNIDPNDKPDPSLFENLYTYEIEEIAWKKESGSNKWIGKQTIARCFAEEGLDQMRERIKEFIDIAIRENTPEQLYKDEFLKFREEIQLELLEVVPKLEIIKQDWDPRGSIPSESMPKDYEIYRRPYVYRESYGGDGGLINLSAGTYNDFDGALLAADGIRALEQARTSTLTVTNVGEVFKIGQCDSPSFSISSDGINSTGVFLNG